MFAPRTGSGFLFASFFGVFTFVIFNRALNDAVVIGLAMAVSIAADLIIRWRTARRLRRETERHERAVRDAEEDFWEDRR